MRNICATALSLPTYRIGQHELLPRIAGKCLRSAAVLKPPSAAAPQAGPSRKAWYPVAYGNLPATAAAQAGHSWEVATASAMASACSTLQPASKRRICWPLPQAGPSWKVATDLAMPPACSRPRSGAHFTS